MSELKSLSDNAAYEEAGQNYRKFLDWREKIVGGYVAILGALGVAFHASEGNCRFQSALLWAAVLTSAAFWVLNDRNSEFIRTCVVAGKKQEEPVCGIYTSLHALKDTTLLTHGFAVSLLVSGVVVGSLYELWMNWACWASRGFAVAFLIFLVVLVLLECRGRGRRVI
jgi:hypothetical protein